MNDNQKTISENKHFLFNVVIKASLLFFIINIIFAGMDLEADLGRISLYNRIFPGRKRLPFGENTAEAYNLSLYNVDAMIRSHEVASRKINNEEVKVFIVGDSATWGTLLTPEQTLAGQLNEMNLSDESGKPIKFYNLGYPTLSLAKDLMIMTEVEKYGPDIILWLVTLEAFPKQEQFTSPIVTNNEKKINSLFTQYGLIIQNNSVFKKESIWDKTIIGKRRSIADILRLQFYGVLWAATGIDQYYPEDYEPAQRDLSDELDYYEIEYPNVENEDLAFDVLQTGIEKWDQIPVYLINEPVLISSGLNSDIRYNFYYPRWVYDEYRQMLRNIAEKENWQYQDYWNIVPEEEFTNTAIHMTPYGVSILAEQIRDDFFQTWNQ